MNQYYVYTTEPELLKEKGQVYYPKIKMSFVVLTTDCEVYEIRSIGGVYDVKECPTMMLGSQQGI